MECLQKILEGAEIKDEKLNVEALMSAISKEMPKHFVPKEDFNTKVSELKTANDTIKTLKESNQDNETLQLIEKKKHNLEMIPLYKEYEQSLDEINRILVTIKEDFNQYFTDLCNKMD